MMLHVLLPLLFTIGDCSNGAKKLQFYALLHPSEIIFLVDDYGFAGTDQFEEIAGIIRKLPDYFSLGDKSVRVAIFLFGEGKRKVGFGLTTDAKLIRNFRPGGFRYTYEALTYVLADVLNGKRPEATPIIILVTNGQSAEYSLKEPNKRWFEGAVEMTDHMRKKQMQVYVAYVGKINDTLQSHYNQLTADPTQVFPIHDFTMLPHVNDANKTEMETCNFQQICHFLFPNKCESVAWPSVMDQNCENYSPTPKTCENEDCVKTCEQLWRWNEANCTGKAGQTVKVGGKAVEELLRPEILRHCPHEKEVKCSA